MYGGDYHRHMLSWQPQALAQAPGVAKHVRAFLQAHERRAEFFAAWLARRVEPGGRMLDLGAAAGFFLWAAARRGWEPEGVELNPATARHARAVLNFPMYNADFADLDLPRESFTVITAWDFIEHVPDPAASLRRIHELLRPGGVLALATPDHRGWYPQASFALRGVFGDWPHADPPRHLFQFSERSLARLLNAAGFARIERESRRLDFVANFGDLEAQLTAPRRLLATLLLGPVYFAAPWFGRGDLQLVLARKG